MNTPTENEIEVLLSDLSAGAVYRVHLETKDGVVAFHSMLGGIKARRGYRSITFENGVEITSEKSEGLKFFRKVW